MWVDDDGFGLNVGDVGFLIESTREGVTRYFLRVRPLHMNQSRKPLLFGWGGETNNVSRYARGVVRVVRVTETGRARVVGLLGTSQGRALESLGWPDLSEGCAR
jgi:hypothetical protein